MTGVTYKDAGVDIEAGNKAVELIKKRVSKLFPLIRVGKVISDLGGFGAIIELEDGRIIVATTDGVGTKLIIAILMDKHDTVGIDLGAMCYNDLIAVGVLPLFFLNYIAQGKQIPSKTAKIISGILDGCEEAKCPTIGGEMAECPGLYNLEEYDLAGFSVGLAGSRNDLILGTDIEPGMYLYGLLSSGLHSNSYSLVRKILGIDINSPVASIKRLNEYMDSLGCTLGEELLRPTIIYVDIIEKLMKKYFIAGMANITGGGLLENPPRILPDGCAIKIYLNTWEPHPIFKLIQERGNVNQLEMLTATNYGIGFVVVSPDEIEEDGVIKIGKVVGHSEKKVFFE